MNESTAFGATQVPPDVQFAQVLENFQLGGGSISPFEVTQAFTSIAAGKAIEVQNNADSDASVENSQEFVSWDLETQLWHLVTVLYSFRLGEDTAPIEVHDNSSFAIKQLAYLQTQPKLQELLLIIQWIQHNSPEISTQIDPELGSKWNHTKVALENKDLAALASSDATANYVDSLDDDAPLRTSKVIAPGDVATDAINFSRIYQLVLAGKYQEAVDYATQTGNFTLALILVGAQQDFIDPAVDDPDHALRGSENGDILDNSTPEPSGLRHKYLWLQTVYNLSREERLIPEERLIYSYLCGGDQTSNIKHAGTSWNSCLLLYVNQLLTHHLRTFLQTLLVDNGGDLLSLSSVSFPTPQHTSVENILNSMSKSSDLAEESKNPFRVIIGSILINQLNFFLDNTFKASQLSIVEDQHILRVLAHLAVVSTVLGIHEGSRTPTKIITKYISKLSEHGYEDLVPIYLAFIPDERDVRECYSIFLSTITDSEKRAKQLEMFRRLGVNPPVEPASDSTPANVTDDYEYKIHNVLKRTVERVMAETEQHYSQQEAEIQIEDSVVDSTDFKLCKSVEWFFENNMYEDAINATRIVFQRFLATGRLKAIKEFGRGKNLKELIKNYDFELQTSSIGGSDLTSSISDSQKDEVLQYEKLLECLLLLEEWKAFTSNTARVHWTSKDVENSIEKVVGKIRDLIFSWFRGNLESSPEEAELYKEYRSIYIPYFIVELLQIFHEARLHDRKYLGQAFVLVNDVANDKENDLLQCFLACGRISEFVVLAGEIAAVAAEAGKTGTVF